MYAVLFCVFWDLFAQNTQKRKPYAQDAPPYYTQVMMMENIQLKLIRIWGGGGTLADNDEDKDVEKDVDDNKDLMKDNLL